MLATALLQPENLDKILADLPIEADWIGLRWVKAIDRTRSARDGVPQTNGNSVNSGIMVEVIVNGQIGYGATNYLTPTGIAAAAQAAHQQAVATSQYHLHPWSIEQRPQAIGHYKSAQANSLDSLSVAAIDELLIKICQGLKVSDQIVQTRAMVNTKEIETFYVSSNGSNIYQQVQLLVSDYGATAQAGNVTQTRSNGGTSSHCYQGGWDYFNTPNLWARPPATGAPDRENCHRRLTSLRWSRAG